MTTQTSDFETTLATLVAARRDGGGDPRALTAALMRAALDTGIRRELRGTVQPCSGAGDGRRAQRTDRPRMPSPGSPAAACPTRNTPA